MPRDLHNVANVDLCMKPNNNTNIYSYIVAPTNDRPSARVCMFAPQGANKTREMGICSSLYVCSSRSEQDTRDGCHAHMIPLCIDGGCFSTGLGQFLFW